MVITIGLLNRNGQNYIIIPHSLMPAVKSLSLSAPQFGRGNVLTHVCLFVSRIAKKVMAGFSEIRGNRYTIRQVKAD